MTYPSHVVAARLKVAMGARLVFAMLLILSLLFIQSEPGRAHAPGYAAAYWLLIAISAANLVYLILARVGFDPRRLATLQVAADIVLVSLLVYSTGIDRVFAYFYFATVLSAALLINPEQSFLFASLATVLLSAVSILHYLAGQAVLSLPFVSWEILSAQRVEIQSLVPFLLSFAVSLHVAAFLSGYLARELARVRILSHDVLENISQGIVAVDRTGRIAQINAEARRMLRLPEGRWEGRSYADAVRRPEILQAVTDTIAGRRQITLELVLGGAPVEVTTTPLAGPSARSVSEARDSAGRRGETQMLGEASAAELRGVAIILNDLSLRKKVEEAERTEERFRSLVELSASLAHEIRNPLASIKGAGQELAGAVPAGGDDGKLFLLLVREVDRLDNILSSFLEYASPRALALGVCNIPRLLEEISTMLEARARGSPVGIFRRFQDNVFCKGDEDRLRQVFLNIGINAIEALGPSGGRILLSCKLDGAGGAEIEIEDNGCGIARDVLPRIFDPFFTTKPAGTGMGLAVARKIIQAHEGRISISSEPGRGTRCRVWLPS